MLIGDFFAKDFVKLDPLLVEFGLQLLVLLMQFCGLTIATRSRLISSFLLSVSSIGGVINTFKSFCSEISLSFKGTRTFLGTIPRTELCATFILEPLALA